MAIIIIGGHSRSVGKTSVVAGLISALPQMNWTAIKITQYGHGVCSADGGPCDCATDDHTFAVTEERDRSGESDTSRFVLAGAKKVYWVRTRQGMLAEAIPRIRQVIASADNVIFESNSLVKFIRPDLYVTVLDFANPDFKASAREFLDRADALILQNADLNSPAWNKVSLKPVTRKLAFHITPPNYVTPEIVDFVRDRISHLALESK
ncbi:MAG TPA: hypothetical protein VG897_02860 [Terriglobales bacterium]|nr:hypothetical protein [Terriglobales bacterium]